MEAIINNILEFFYILIGLLSIMTAVRVFKDPSNTTGYSNILAFTWYRFCFRKLYSLHH